MNVCEQIKQYYVSVLAEKSTGFWGGLFKVVLWVFSWIYSGVLVLTQWCQRIGKQSLSQQVISIGNITWGGTGKTPFVIFLAKYLQKQGRCPAILTRGYGNDEHILLKRHLPSLMVVTDASRYRAAHKALMRDPNINVFLLDDGFQHIQLSRNVDIVMIDGVCPFGNNHLIPRGILREPLSHLSRADIILINRCPSQEVYTQITTRIQHAIAPRTIPFFCVDMHYTGLVEYPDEVIRPQSFLMNKEVCVFCGIANPQRFLQDLHDCKISVKKEFLFTDHYPYEEADIIQILEQAKKAEIDVLLTTEKDIVRLQDRGLGGLLKDSGFMIYYPHMTLTIQNEHEFIDRLYRKCMS